MQATQGRGAPLPDACKGVEGDVRVRADVRAGREAVLRAGGGGAAVRGRRGGRLRAHAQPAGVHEGAAAAALLQPSCMGISPCMLLGPEQCKAPLCLTSHAMSKAVCKEEGKLGLSWSTAFARRGDLHARRGAGQEGAEQGSKVPGGAFRCAQNKLLLVPGRGGAHNEASKVELVLQGQAFLPDLSITGRRPLHALYSQNPIKHIRNSVMDCIVRVLLGIDCPVRQNLASGHHRSRRSTYWIVRLMWSLATEHTHM